MSNITNFLAAYYCEPDDEIFYNEELNKVFFENCKIFDDELSKYAINTIDALKKYSNNELLQEYTRIFLGPFEAIAHPYASVYLEGYILNGEVTQKILHFYNNCGLLFEEDVKDLPDNIVVMLQFLHYLITCEMQGNENLPEIDWTEKRKEFIDLYLNTWIPKFTEQIITGTQNEFYKNLALFTKKFFEII
jgi:TorA maturation chaperone TorD